MCDPATIVMGAVAIGGKFMENNAARSASRADRLNAESNAKYVDLQAQDAIERGKADQEMIMLDTAEVQGRQMVLGAASGADVGSGTLARLQEDSAFMGALDVQVAKNNARREALGLEAEANNIRTGAAYRSAANRIGRQTNLGTTLLTTGADLYGSYLKGR